MCDCGGTSLDIVILFQLTHFSGYFTLLWFCKLCSHLDMVCVIAMDLFHLCFKCTDNTSQQSFRNNHQQSKDSKTKTLTITMLAVSIVFVITTLPDAILMFMQVDSEFLATVLITEGGIFLRVIGYLDNINHSINFLLYCLSGSIFMQTLVCLCQS